MGRLRLIAPVAAAAGLAATAFLGSPASAHSTAAAVTHKAPSIGGCTVFPASNAWNTDISHAPVDAHSAAYIKAIGSAIHLHADFGSGQYGDYGIPITVVPASQTKVPIRFTAYGDESDKGPYPVPANARVEGGRSSDGDRHVLVVQQGSCKLYELYDAHSLAHGAWSGDSGAVFDLTDPALRPAGWTSADAAGLPIAPGLARADETDAGFVGHAIRVTVPRSQCRYAAPARHEASDDCSASLPPMGLRLRLKASFSLAEFHGQARVLLQAMKTYGLIVADNGSPWYVGGTPDTRWNDDDLDQLKTVPGSAFQAVKTGPLHR